jgi:hypothetical protein
MLVSDRWIDAAAHLRYQRRYGRFREQRLGPFQAAGAVFVHIPKTAGVSVTAALFGAAVPAAHMSARQFRRIFGPSQFARLFTFTFVRDPIDRLLSAYSYIQAGGRGTETDRSAASLIRSCSSIEEFTEHWLPRRDIQAIPHLRPQTGFVCDRRGDVIVDFVGRFEQLQTDFSVVASRLGQTRELPLLNQGPVDKPTISAAARRSASEFYADDFKALGYEPH